MTCENSESERQEANPIPEWFNNYGQALDNLGSALPQPNPFKAIGNLLKAIGLGSQAALGDGSVSGNVIGKALGAGIGTFIGGGLWIGVLLGIWAFSGTLDYFYNDKFPVPGQACGKKNCVYARDTDFVRLVFFVFGIQVFAYFICLYSTMAHLMNRAFLRTKGLL